MPLSSPLCFDAKNCCHLGKEDFLHEQGSSSVYKPSHHGHFGTLLGRKKEANRVPSLQLANLNCKLYFSTCASVIVEIYYLFVV